MKMSLGHARRREEKGCLTQKFFHHLWMGIVKNKSKRTGQRVNFHRMEKNRSKDGFKPGSKRTGQPPFPSPLLPLFLKRMW